MMEHYADGDLVNADTAIRYVPVGENLLASWGHKVPFHFLQEI